MSEVASAEPTVSPSDKPELTILVPVYNEKGNILPLVQEIHDVIADTIPFEVLMVDDGSDDGSAEDLADAKRRHQAVRVIRHTTRSGKSAALVTGRKAARGTWIQTLDGDGQNDPADVVTAWRTIHADGGPHPRLGILAGQRKRRNDGAFKWVQSRIANHTRRLLLRDGTADTGCGFKMMRRDAFEDVPFFDGMHRFLPALMRRAGWDVLQMPVNDRPRTQGNSKYGFTGRLTAGVFDLLGVVWLMRRGKFPEDRSGDL